MPSGAKKRKAAKKKKEKETNNTNPQGIDELKSQDDKGSDGGSPAYHDHDDDHHRHPFNEGNEEAEEGNQLVPQPSAVDAKSVEEVSRDVKIDDAMGRREDGGVVVERESKDKEDNESKGVNVAHAESAKESGFDENGNSNSFSKVESVAEKSSKDAAFSSIKETVTFDELVKSIDSSHTKMTSVDSLKPAGSVAAVNSGGTGNSLGEKQLASHVGATESATTKDGDVRTPSLEEPEPKEFDLPPVSRGPLPESTNATEHVKDSDTADCSEDQPPVASAPQMVQKTSWLNCCGVFEVLSGNNR